MKLCDKVVVITGSGGGIGAACARRFAAEGAKVVVTDIDPDGVERVSDSIGSVGLAGDITAEDTVRAVAELARDTYGEVDIWFSNAGYAGPPRAGDIADDHLWDLSWRLHVMSHVYAVRQMLPSMLARGDGYLLQTASVVALTTHPDKAAYAVTKHAALALSEWLALTYRPKGIKVSCFCPGPMRTPMLMPTAYPPIIPPEECGHPGAGRRTTGPRQSGPSEFLIVDSTMGTDSLTAKGADYERWISDLACPHK